MSLVGSAIGASLLLVLPSAAFDAIVPVLIARDGDRLLLHGSTGAGALRHVAAGARAAICVTHLDALVMGPFVLEKANIPGADAEVLTPEQIAAAYGLD